MDAALQSLVSYVIDTEWRDPLYDDDDIIEQLARDEEFFQPYDGSRGADCDSDSDG